MRYRRVVGADTGELDDNIMFYRLGDSSELSGEQRSILRGSPLLR